MRYRYGGFPAILGAKPIEQDLGFLTGKCRWAPVVLNIFIFCDFDFSVCHGSPRFITVFHEIATVLRRFTKVDPGGLNRGKPGRQTGTV
jgi:hypothetical protein